MMLCGEGLAYGADEQAGHGAGRDSGGRPVLVVIAAVLVASQSNCVAALLCPCPPFRSGRCLMTRG